MVKTTHYAIVDEAWYFQPKCPPFTQMMYDVGLEEHMEPITLLSTYVPLPSQPPLLTAKPLTVPKAGTIWLLPL